MGLRKACEPVACALLALESYIKGGGCVTCTVRDQCGRGVAVVSFKLVHDAILRVLVLGHICVST